MPDERDGVTSPVNSIAPLEQRQSGITSHDIGVNELAMLLDLLPGDCPAPEYEAAVVSRNELGLATENGREWRYATLRRLYLLDPGEVLFRSLRELWAVDPESRPLLAVLMAMTQDTVLRVTAAPIHASRPGDELSLDDFADAVYDAYPEAYADSTMRTIKGNAARSWEQSGHLGPAAKGVRTRSRAVAGPAALAFAFLLGHVEGHRGTALFETPWALTLDQPRSLIVDLAFVAAQQGMLEYREGGGVIEVGFSHLLRPIEGDAS